MIKIFTRFLFLFLSLAVCTTSNSQTNIANYQFSKTFGNVYTPLTGDVTIFSTWDTDASSALPLGGTFTYGGVPYTTCYVSSNGYLTFGASSTSSTPLSSTAASVLGFISAYGQDGANSTLAGTTPKVSYATVGNEFVVQFQDHANYWNRSTERMNFQIRLNLSTNAINIIYGNCTLTGTSTSGGTAQVGLRGNTSTWATNINNLMLANVPTGTSCTWADAVTGNANSSSLVYLASTNANITIPNGLMYTWTPATAPAPVRTFKAVSSVTTSGATVSWAASSGASQYNVQYRTIGSCDWTDFSGPTTDSTVTLTGLTPSTTYQIRVQAVSGSNASIWSHIPTGAAGSGLNGYTTSGTFTTLAACISPTSPAISSVTTNSASVSFSGVGNSFIAEYGPTGFIPGTGATAGTSGTITTGSSSPLIISGLTPGTTYDLYVRQNCTSAGNGYSTNSAKVSFLTNCTAVTTFSENFDGLTTPTLPTCFRKVGTGGLANTQTSGSSSSPNTLYIYSGTTSSQALVALNPVINAGTGTNQLRFKLRANSTAGDTLQVGYLTNISDSSSFVVLAQFRAASTSVYSEYVVTPGTAPGSSQYLAFRAKGTSGYSMLIDDIFWEPIPACTTPTAASVGTITNTSANVNFTSTGNNFIVEYGVTGFTPGTGATAGTGGMIVSGNSSPITITGLSGSTTYQVYVRQNCTASGNGYSANSQVVAFTTSATPPANDDASGAISLTVGAGCTGAPYTLAGATISTGEPYPSCSGIAYGPVWFKFVAPASGAVRVSTDLGSGNTLSDSKLGLFSATNPSNYSTFSIISCDEDGGASTGTTGSLLSVLYATGLTSGTTYYIAVDKYSSSTTSGTFCVAVDELATSMLSTIDSCGSSYQAPFGSNSTYTGWVPLLDVNSKLVALVQNAAGGNVSSYVVRENVNTGSIRQSQGTYYLDRNFRITNSTATNVNVQFFFLQSELAALHTVDPLVTLGNIGVTRQTELVAGCYNNFDTSKGPISFIAQSGNGSANGVNWISFATPGFSNFYLHRNGTALPIKFEYLRGKNIGVGNALSWKVTCTSTSITMVLERSADGRTFSQAVTSITATQARCGQPFDYTDAAPLSGTNYYRLKMIDVDGKVSYSPTVALMNGKAGAELVGIYPTVVKEIAYLSVTSSRNTQLQLSISDMSGKVIKTTTQAISSGSSLLNINTSNLATGVYNITGLLDGVRTQTLRFVKQ